MDVDRSFEGRAVLEKLLTASGSLADAEDVAGAFEKAIAEGVPAPVVIQALWEDEPRFESPRDAARLFSNLLGLYELLAEGKKVDLTKPGPKAKREKASKPEPFGAEGPTDEFVEAAWRWFEDFPKERQKLEHSFENRQDMLILWLDDAGLSDAGFALSRHLVGEVFAMLELGGKKTPTVHGEDVPKKAKLETLPAALTSWLEEAVFEAQSDDEQPLPEAEAAKVREIVARASTALLG
ncbi:MAG: hypothetical protein U0228_21605 [Myxococcaceae bacterium]